MMSFSFLFFLSVYVECIFRECPAFKRESKIQSINHD
jgi:hypothetical protein